MFNIYMKMINNDMEILHYLMKLLLNRKIQMNLFERRIKSNKIDLLKIFNAGVIKRIVNAIIKIQLTMKLLFPIQILVLADEWDHLHRLHILILIDFQYFFLRAHNLYSPIHCFSFFFFLRYLFTFFLTIYSQPSFFFCYADTYIFFSFSNRSLI